MRIDLGAKVRTKDGHGAGHIKQAIWDPRGNEVTEYVLSTGGLLSHDAIVSRELLEGATRAGDEIVVDLTKKELDELARFEPTAYTSPPAGWLAPTVYDFPTGAYLFPLTDGDIARGVEQPPPNEELGRGPKLRKGMKVRDAAGEVVGEVEELRVDDATGELRGVLVKHEGDLLEIDAADIDQVDEDVRLASAGRELRGREKA